MENYRTQNAVLFISYSIDNILTHNFYRTCFYEKFPGFRRQLSNFPLACTESRFRILASFGFRASIDLGLEMSHRNCTNYQENAGLG